jgi:hypothetical protein
MGRETRDSLVDKSGQTVRVGDYILYASSLGRCAALSFGRILKIELVDGKDWRIGFIGVDDYYGMKLKKGTLQFPDRLVLANAFIPEQHKSILER